MRLRLYILFFGVAAVAMGIALAKPLSFQKNNSIRSASAPIPAPEPSDFEIVPFLAGIPYKDESAMKAFQDMKPLFTFFNDVCFRSAADHAVTDCSIHRDSPIY